MTIKLLEILRFENFYSKIKDKKLPVKTAYKLTKFFNKVDEEIKFYQTRIMEICEAYGERDKNNNFIPLEGGAGIKVKEDKIKECQLEIQALSDLEVEVPQITVSLEELDGLELSIEELYPILPFIAE